MLTRSTQLSISFVKRSVNADDNDSSIYISIVPEEVGCVKNH